MRFVYLDTGPLGLVSHPKAKPDTVRCMQWVNDRRREVILNVSRWFLGIDRQQGEGSNMIQHVVANNMKITN
jgi:hypothetical protein